MSNRLKPLTLGTPPQVIMSDLRRDIILKRTGFNRTTRKSEKLFHLLDFSHLPDAHVYDMGGLLSQDNADRLSAEANEALNKDVERLRANLGVFLPHSATTFIERDKGAGRECLRAFVARELEDHIAIQVFNYQLSDPTQWLWVWIGEIDLNHHDLSKLGGCAFDFDQEGGRLMAQHSARFVVASIALINRKSDLVLVEPAEWELANEPARPKAFETRNPSVSVVKVNTPRILLAQPRDDETGTGATVRPHDRRAHLRRVGNRIIKVRNSKIHGGAPFPTAKVVKL